MECTSDFILIGEKTGIKICKSLYSPDLINCDIINDVTGLCDKCKDGFYLNSGDKICLNEKIAMSQLLENAFLVIVDII